MPSPGMEIKFQLNEEYCYFLKRSQRIFEPGLNGFLGVAESELLQGDLFHETVKWKNGKLEDVKNQVVSLKFTLKNASFYSYWFDK